MAQVGAFGCSGLAVHGLEGVGFGPGLEHFMGIPQRVRDEEGAAFDIAAFEHFELDEAGHGVEFGVAGAPDFDKAVFEAGCDAETVHGDVHGGSFEGTIQWAVILMIR